MSSDAVHGALLAPLARAERLPWAGGKARGLSMLCRCGFAVPEGIVLQAGRDGSLPVGLAEFCAAMGGPLIVRSSAMVEDGSDASYAGQFESVMNLRGFDEVRAAIVHCKRATQRAAQYQLELGTGRASQAVAGEGAMAFVVQRMIEAQCSGVLFTVDPVTGDGDRMVLEATAGTGEKLTAGRESAQRYVYAMTGALLEAPRRQERLLDEERLAQIFSEARRAQHALGPALDLEWALSPSGTLYWLQVRPVTTQVDADRIRAIESPSPDPRWLITRYNAREIVPGALTPLSRAPILRGLDAGFLEMSAESGIPLHRLRDLPLSLCYHGHLFLNLSAMYIVSEYVLGTSKARIDYSLAGSLLPGDENAPQPTWVRARNLVRYLRMLRQVPERFARFERQLALPQFDVSCNSYRKADEIHRVLGAARETAVQAGRMHMYTSTLSGAAYGFLAAVIAEGREPPDARDHGKVSALLRSLSNDSDGDSSLGIGSALAKLAMLVRAADPEGAFRGRSPEAATAWLRTEAPEDVRRAYQDLLLRHGHRGIKECDLYEPDWSENPLPLVRSVQSMLEIAPRPIDDALGAQTLAGLAPVPRQLARWLSSWVRKTIVLRERSKSLWVRSLRAQKPGYRLLGEFLRDNGRLPEAELVYFLSHEEIGELVAGPGPRVAHSAVRRRRMHRWQSQLRFSDVCLGAPQPRFESVGDFVGEELRGTPVCTGIAMGPARVAHTLEEAMQLLPGEVLVVPHTDVGWVPLFPRAAGLATEIGGTLSHGAVVAREFGLPAVVNVPGATRWLRSGDPVILDGGSGILRRVAARGGRPA